MATLPQIALEEFDNKLRLDGIRKSTGFLGPLQMRDGSGRLATELSMTFDTDKGQILLPSLIPGLSEIELDFVLGGPSSRSTNIDDIKRSLFEKMFSHFRKRRIQGLSAFFNEGEIGTNRHDQFDSLGGNR